MKKEIHPTYYAKAKVTCACGNAFQIGATKEVIEVEVCSACHPFYSGGARNLDKVGQVQKFQKRMEKAQTKKKKKK